MLYDKFREQFPFCFVLNVLDCGKTIRALKVSLQIVDVDMEAEGQVHF